MAFAETDHDVATNSPAPSLKDAVATIQAQTFRVLGSERLARILGIRQRILAETDCLTDEAAQFNPRDLEKFRMNLW